MDIFSSLIENYLLIGQNEECFIHLANQKDSKNYHTTGVDI